MDAKRILLVDDDQALTRSLGRYLARLDRFEVRTENRGAAAVAAAREFQPHLILLDIVMPDLDGTEVAAALDADPDLRNVPVVFLTGLVSPEEVGRGEEVGGHPFLAKPVEPAELVERIEEFLDLPRVRTREPVSEEELIQILNRSMWRHETCALCQFEGGLKRSEAPGVADSNWSPPELSSQDEAIPEECREIADQILKEAMLRYEVEW